MALNFRPYDDAAGRETRARWSRGLEGIMEQYLASKQNAQQQGRLTQQDTIAAQGRINAEKDRQGANLLQYGFDPRAVTPEVLARSQPGLTPQGPAQPGMPSPEQAENPLFGAVRSFLEKKRSAAGMETQKQQADIDLTQSKIGEAKHGSGGMTKAQLLAFSSGDPKAIADNFPEGIPDQSLRFGTAFMNANAQAGERSARRADRRSDESVKLVDRFNADASVKKAQQALDGAANVIALVESGNPIAAAAIPTYMARASGEVGALSEADKAPFGGSRAIFERLEASLTQAASGQMTPENAKFVRDLGTIMSKRANENIDRLARTRAKQYGRANDFLDENEIYRTLRPESEEVDKPKSDPLGLFK